MGMGRVLGQRASARRALGLQRGGRRRRGEGGYRSGPPRSGSVISLTPTGLPGRAAERLIKKKSSTKRSSGGCGGAGASALVQAGGHGAAGGSHRSPPPAAWAVTQRCGGGGAVGQWGGGQAAAGCPCPRVVGLSKAGAGALPHSRGGTLRGGGLGWSSHSAAGWQQGRAPPSPPRPCPQPRPCSLPPSSHTDPPAHGHQGWAGCRAAGLSCGETTPSSGTPSPAVPRTLPRVCLCKRTHAWLGYL